jgi:uncharacterized protein
LCATVSAAPYNIPPIPEDYNFTWDRARLLEPNTLRAIGALQKKAYNDNDVPIIVVTIRSMSRYGASSIEPLATAWFNEWGIGKSAEKGMNKGILLLISRDDRKLRIELGADYGQDWNDFSKRIIDEEIVPNFKRNDYDEGVLQGVAALAEMAALGIDNPPPTDYMFKAKELLLESEPLTPVSMMPGGMSFLVLGLALLFLVLGFIYPQFRKTFFILAGLLFLVAFVALIIAVIGGIFLRSRGGGGGGFGSSGGFGGGFSGGGGASGGW